jgi:hypothetical protein
VVDRGSPSALPEEAHVLISGLSDNLRQATTDLCQLLVVDFGASLYVKTIYVGAEVNGEMVAAFYPKAEAVDIALALDEDHPSEILEDATHLTWRTMPVLAILRTESSIESIRALVREAGDRVTSGTHDVLRDPDYFRGRTRRLSHDPSSAKAGGRP